jgi:plasmid stabilization system protein ParE
VKLAFSREARSDLVRLRAFIAKHNPSAAEHIAKRLIQGIERLLRHPRLGRRVTVAPDQLAPEEIRDWPIGPIGDYVVRYLITEDKIVVLRIWHSKEQRPRVAR